MGQNRNLKERIEKSLFDGYAVGYRMEKGWIINFLGWQQSIYWSEDIKCTNDII